MKNIHIYGTVVDTGKREPKKSLLSKIQKSLSESESRHQYFSTNDNTHIGNNTDEISNALNDHYSHFDDHSIKAINNYSAGSSDMNMYNLNRHNTSGKEELDLRHEKSNQALDKALHTHKLDRYLDTYHGASFHPGVEAAKHPEGRLFMPAYTSTSISKHQAKSFGNEDSNGHHHIIHFHHAPGAAGGYIQQHSDYPDEHEFLIPRNVSWKIHPEPDSVDYAGRKYKIWHAYDMQHHTPDHVHEGRAAVENFENDPIGTSIKYNSAQSLNDASINHDLLNHHVRQIHEHPYMMSLLSNIYGGHGFNAVINHPATTKDDLNKFMNSYNPEQDDIGLRLRTLDSKHYSEKDRKDLVKQFAQKLSNVKFPEYSAAQALSNPHYLKHVEPSQVLDHMAKSTVSSIGRSMAKKLAKHHDADEILEAMANKNETDGRKINQFWNESAESLKPKQNWDPEDFKHMPHIYNHLQKLQDQKSLKDSGISQSVIDNPHQFWHNHALSKKDLHHILDNFHTNPSPFKHDDLYDVLSTRVGNPDMEDVFAKAEHATKSDDHSMNKAFRALKLGNQIATADPVFMKLAHNRLKSLFDQNEQNDLHSHLRRMYSYMPDVRKKYMQMEWPNLFKD